jgi:hypothetical protein
MAERGDLALLTPHEIAVLEAAQQDLWAWMRAHHEAVAIAGASETAELLADTELDPLWVGYWRRRDLERKQQRSAGQGGQDAAPPPLVVDACRGIQ